MSTTLRVSKPGDLIAAVPYLLGFHPTLSMVVIMLTPSSRAVAGTLRFDLPDQDLPAVAKELARLLTRNKITQVLLAGYGPGPQVTPVMDTLRQMLPEQRIEVVEALRVDDGRYWSYLCTDPTCCPPEGTPTESCGHVVGGAVVAGLVALPDRAALEATLAPVEGERRAAMREATKAAHVRARASLRIPMTGAYWYGEGRAEIKRALTDVDQDRALSDEQVAWLGILLTIIQVRDAVIALWPEFDEQTQLRCWSEVTRRVQPAYLPAPACLTAIMAMLNGDGALAAIAVQRALAVDPAYSMARLLDTGLRVGIPPRVVAEMKTPTLEQDLARIVAENPGKIHPTLHPLAPKRR
jgi:hypothetical protein